LHDRRHPTEHLLDGLGQERRLPAE
jgi:hypothetical protein